MVVWTKKEKIMKLFNKILIGLVCCVYTGISFGQEPQHPVRVGSLVIKDTLNLGDSNAVALSSNNGTLLTSETAATTYATLGSVGSSVGGGYTAKYIFDYSDTTAPPSQRELLTDSTDHADITQLFVSNLTADGYNIGSILSTITDSSSIQIYDINDPTTGSIYRIDSSSSTGLTISDYSTLYVNYIDQGDGGLLSAVEDTIGIQLYHYEPYVNTTDNDHYYFYWTKSITYTTDSLPNTTDSIGNIVFTENMPSNNMRFVVTSYNNDADIDYVIEVYNISHVDKSITKLTTTPTTVTFAGDEYYTTAIINSVSGSIGDLLYFKIIPSGSGTRHYGLDIGLEGYFVYTY